MSTHTDSGITIESETPLEAYIALARAMEKDGEPIADTMLALVQAAVILAVTLAPDRAGFTKAVGGLSSALNLYAQHHAGIQFGRMN